MSEIRFYHLQNQSLEQVLPSLLSKALSVGNKIVVKVADEKRVKVISEHLWSYRADSFLPHGSSKDGHADMQPIYVTAEDENPNGASVLILADGCTSSDMGDYTLCCEMLNGRDDAQVKAARGRWKEYQAQGHDITYWQQGERGGWEKKA